MATRANTGTSKEADTRVEALDSAASVLVFARLQRAAADRAEANVLLAAVAWAEQHPPESIELAATWVSGGGDTGLTLAGPGAPLVAEFCLAELALALGISSEAGRNLVADAVELKYRLPCLWLRVQDGDLPTWRARRVAQRTLGLCPEAARFVDAQVAAYAHRVGPAQVERLVEEAMFRFLPALAQETADRAADGRHVSFHHDQVSFTGTTSVTAELDLADALYLDAALSQGAETLKVCGSTETLDVRRSLAAGEIARHQLGLDLTDAGAEPEPERTKHPGRAW